MDDMIKKKKIFKLKNYLICLAVFLCHVILAIIDRSGEFIYLLYGFVTTGILVSCLLIYDFFEYLKIRAEEKYRDSISDD